MESISATIVRAFSGNPGILTAAVLTAIFAVTATAAQGQPGPAPRNDKWKVLGMGGGGTMIFPTVSPHDPNIVLEGCDMTGAYITLDGGNSYRMFNLGGVAAAYAFDPKDAKVIYAGTDGVWKSSDTGKTWSLIFPDPARNTYETMRGDHADHGFMTDQKEYPGGIMDVAVTGIAVDAADTKRIFAAFNGGWRRAANARVCASEDGGKTWKQLREFASSDILAIGVAAEGGALTCVTDGGVSVMSGGKWEDYAAPEGVEFYCASIGMTQAGKRVIYATARASWTGEALVGGVWVSADGGKTWKDQTAGISAQVKGPGSGRRVSQLRAAACPAYQAETAYVGFVGLALGEGREGTYNGILKTSDMGETWQVVKKESTAAAENSTPVWVEERMPEGGSVWFDTPRDLGAAPNNADICYATDLFRTCRTTDGGKTWETITSYEVSDDKWNSRGLDVTTCYGVHFDPFNENNIYISYTDMGMFRSDDRGRSWTNSIEGIPMAWRNTTYWLEFDPDVEGLVWGVFSGTHDIPRPKMWRQRGVSRYRGGVATSTDGCRTWTVTDDGINESAVTHILMDPESPVGKRTLYACGFGKGVFKSVDNGKTWAMKNKGIAGKEPFVWRITRASDATLYLVVARRGEGDSHGDDNDGALYKSTDGAETWEKMALPEGCNGPNGLTLDPKDEKRMYLAAWGNMNDNAGDSGGGIFLSTDAGATWEHVMKDDQHVYDVTADGRNGILYACGFESSAYRSADRGETWSRIKGYNFKWGHRVTPDPQNADMIYITTFGGSVWYGPAGGDESAVEDIVTPFPKKH